jgi:hypothetical protein
MAQLSEYEQQRQRNIDANQVVLNALGLGESNTNKSKPPAQQPKPKKKKKAPDPDADVSLEPVRSGERVRTQRKFQSYAGLDGSSGTGASYGSLRKVRDDSSDSEESDYSVDEDADEVEAFSKRKRTAEKMPRDNGRRETGRCGPRMRDMLAAKAPRRAPSLRPPTVSWSAAAASSIFPSLVTPVAPSAASSVDSSTASIAATHFLGVSPFASSASSASAAPVAAPGAAPVAFSSAAALPLPWPVAEDDDKDDDENDGKVRCPMCRGRFVPKGGRFMRKHNDTEYGGLCGASGQTLEMLGLA